MSRPSTISEFSQAELDSINTHAQEGASISGSDYRRTTSAPEMARRMI